MPLNEYALGGAQPDTPYPSNSVTTELVRFADIIRDCGRIVDKSGHIEKTLRNASAILAALQQAEAVRWGVDWGTRGDRTCVSIIKKHSDGTVEFVANEYEPEANVARKAQQSEAVPKWLTYDAASDVLTIHSKRYAAGMFGEEGFLAPAGTLLRVEAGSPDVVTLTTVEQAEAVPPDVTDAMALAFHRALTDGAIGQSEVEEIKTGLRAAIAAQKERAS